jgi:hypothetical protein
MHDPVRPRRVIEYLARIGLCSGALLITVALAPADPAQGTASREAARDLLVMVHARRALRDDAALGSLNIGLRVRDGVATLWGPVPSADVIPKALKTLNSVQGVLGARSELYVAVPPRIEDSLLLPPPPAEPLATESASPDPVSGLMRTLTARTEKGVPSSSAEAKTGGSAAGVELSAPVPVPESEQRPTAPATKSVVPATQKPPTKSEKLLAAVDRLRQSSPRFRTLRTEVRGTVVIVAGRAEQDEDVMAFARAVSLVPGVERVLTKTDSPTP